MRHLALAGLVLASMGHPAAAQPLDYAKPADAMTMFRKIQCSAKDGEAVVYHWSGRVYSRVPGEPDRHLFNVEGMNVRQCARVADDPQRGAGFRMTSRELMLYLDPKSGQVLRQWQNPWTGKGVEVAHVANDPVNQPPVYATTRAGQPYSLPVRVENGRVFWNVEVPLFYTNPLGGDYQAFVGNQYHAMEIFDFIVDERELRDVRLARANPAVAWVRLSPWLPFMEMGERPGMLVFNATGQTMRRGIDDLPMVLRDEIAARYPTYRLPPPVDDTRPNETSWTAFKRMVDERRGRGVGQ